MLQFLLRFYVKNRIRKSPRMSFTITTFSFSFAILSVLVTPCHCVAGEVMKFNNDIAKAMPNSLNRFFGSEQLRLNPLENCLCLNSHQHPRNDHWEGVSPWCLKGFVRNGCGIVSRVTLVSQTLFKCLLLEKDNCGTML